MPGAGARGEGALPNLVVIGGLKCGTTSLHHYLNLHPEIGMSRPKELNFFVEELNWPLGRDWYASHFDPAERVRGESSPHYTNRPRFDGVAERLAETAPDARLIYMVRDPIDRMLSHYLHNVGGGYDDRPLEEALADPDTAYVDRGRYFFQLEPYLERFERDRIELVRREELKRDRAGTMRRVFAFLGVDEDFTSEQFEREWETGTAKSSGRFRLDGPRRSAAGPARDRPQLRPPARAHALGGRARRPRPRRGRGPQAPPPRRAASDARRALPARRRAARELVAGAASAGSGRSRPTPAPWARLCRDKHVPWMIY